MSVDIWLFTAVVFFILTICAVLRIIPGPTLNDRLIAINVAATLACAGALALTVSCRQSPYCPDCWPVRVHGICFYDTQLPDT